MLSDRLCQLLTAYVDGELSPAQRAAVRRLLRRSAAARQLCRQLQSDAARLRALPRRELGWDLAPVVLQALNPTPAPTARRLAVPEPAPVPTWLGLAAAAAVLFLIGTGSFLYFAALPPEEDDGSALVLVAGPKPLAPEPDAGLPGAGSVPARSEPRNDAAGEPPPEPLPLPRLAEVASAPSPANPPAVSGPNRVEPAAPVLASPSRMLETVIRVVDPGLALVLNVRELDQEKSRQRLADELHRANAYHLELGCVESTKAFERLRGVFQAQGIRLLIDADAQDRLTLNLKANYLLYTEHVEREELAKILRQLGSEDRKAEARRRGDGQFDRLVVNRITAVDGPKLSQLLGVDLSRPDQERPKGLPRADLRESAVGPPAPVESSVPGQGGGRSTTVPSAGGVPERLALVLAFASKRSRPLGLPEIWHFLDSCKERRPGTVQVVLVLRGTDE